MSRTTSEQIERLITSLNVLVEASQYQMTGNDCGWGMFDAIEGHTIVCNQRAGNAIDEVRAFTTGVRRGLDLRKGLLEKILEVLPNVSPIYDDVTKELER